MDDIKIQPIILCGGSGTRLWPLSTAKIPKQFISIGNKGTLLEETIRRVALITNRCRDLKYGVYDPLLIMHKSHNIPEELAKYKNNIIYEEYANDTGVAIARAVIEIRNRYKNEKIIILSLHSDHYIEHVDPFVTDIIEGLVNITDHNIVLYGIEPSSPESKYGYIIPDFNKITFREKPDTNTAAKLISRGALWNSGIFAVNNETLYNYMKESTYNIFDWIDNPREGKAPSFDIAVLQQHPKLYAHISKNWGWQDLGTWSTFFSISEIQDEIIEQSNVFSDSCENVQILNRSQGNIVTIGCDNLIIVMNGNNLLIMSNQLDFSNKLKDIATLIL